MSGHDSKMEVPPVFPVFFTKIVNSNGFCTKLERRKCKSSLDWKCLPTSAHTIMKTKRHLRLQKRRTLVCLSATGTIG